MKVAYTMNGLIGGLGRFKNDERRDEEILIDIAEYVNLFLQKYIVEENDVDIFIYSWNFEHKKELDKIFKPVLSEYHKQIDFLPNIPKRLHENAPRANAHYSRWYGFDKVMGLRRAYEKVHNIKYDLVVNVRFDLCWNHTFDFSKLDTEKVHVGGRIDMPNWGWPHRMMAKGGWELIDHIFAMNPTNMDNFGKMYYKLNEYTKPGQCPQWNVISSHFLAPWHLSKLGLLSTDIVEFTFKDWHNGRNDKADYEILRYRNLTPDKLREDIDTWRKM